MTKQLSTDAAEAESVEVESVEAAAHSDAAASPSGRPPKVSRWDRPPEPHDWRFFVGNLGKVLIATGLLLFGFVGYQLWGTGIETARAQNDLENEFEALIAANRPSAAESAAGEPLIADPADDADDPATDTDQDADDAADEGADPTVVGTDDTGELGTPDEPIVIPVATDLSDEAVEQEIPPIDRGDVLARLQIPRIDQDLYVVAGVSLNDLKDGPGHYPDSPLPGQLGNASIAGHRTTYGAPFFDVDRLAPGDDLVVTMITGDQFVYEVTGIEVVSASDYWVVTTRNPDIAELTLTSCHPKYTARDRIVVHSVLNPEKSANVGVPTFYRLDDAQDEPIPGDDPVLADEPAELDAGDRVSDEGTPGDAVTDEPPAASGDAGADAPLDDGADAPASDDPRRATGAEAPAEVEDAFVHGWFDDPSAWPQIALWGAALTVISLLAYAVSRRFRRYSIGLLVGVAPFLFALYFFYQNVNRLLPPGL